TINPQVGLFGYVENSRGFIRNLKVIDANVTCGPDCGIVVGINYGATISNIKTTGTVTGTGNRGGVYGTSSYSISSFLGSESQIGGDNAGAGGITGRHSIGRIFGASHVGNVTTKSANTGGIAGYAKLLLDNVYQVGNVGSSSASSSSYDVSGLSAGSLAKQSFYIGNVTGFWNSPRVEILASEVSDSYYSADSVCTNLGTGGCSIVGTSIPAAGGTFSNRSSSVFSNWDFDSVWEEVAGSYPRLNPKFSDDGNFNCSDHLSDAPFAGGSGTYQKPYLICTVAQFNAIGANSSKWDKYFKIMSDINMASISATAYKVIGSEAIPFTGFIDGNYKTIENLKVTGSTYVGMIGYGDSFIIRRLTVKNAVITGSGQVGTLTGQVRRYAGFIDINIVNTTITTTSGNVGGMVGFCNQCGLYNFAVTGNVSSTGATSRVGGVIGFFESGSAKSGYFSGAVAGVTSVGGFAGDNHTGPLISNVFVSANITGSGVNVGPFRGIHSSGDSNYQRAFYDSSKSCTGCASMGDAEPIAVTSTFYSKTNPQLDKMDFVNAWRERPDNFPELVMKEPK
ncbi:MAG: hypothetical protein NTV34_19415, partial [Proteobacteria bacterium]|nr:hypothetical protein [Pseudomonadota bacterium]